MTVPAGVLAVVAAAEIATSSRVKRASASPRGTLVPRVPEPTPRAVAGGSVGSSKRTTGASTDVAVGSAGSSVTVTSLSKDGFKGTRVRARSEGTSSPAPVMRIWTAVAPPVTNGSVPLVTPAPRIGESSTFTSCQRDQAASSKVRKKIRAEEGSCWSADQVTPATKNSAVASSCVTMVSSGVSSRISVAAPCSSVRCTLTTGSSPRAGRAGIA